MSYFMCRFLYSRLLHKYYQLSRSGKSSIYQIGYSCCILCVTPCFFFHVHILHAEADNSEHPALRQPQQQKRPLHRAKQLLVSHQAFTILGLKYQILWPQWHFQELSRPVTVQLSSEVHHTLFITLQSHFGERRLSSAFLKMQHAIFTKNCYPASEDISLAKDGSCFKIFTSANDRHSLHTMFLKTNKSGTKINTTQISYNYLPIIKLINMYTLLWCFTDCCARISICFLVVT